MSTVKAALWKTHVVKNIVLNLVKVQHVPAWSSKGEII